MAAPNLIIHRLEKGNEIRMSLRIYLADLTHDTVGLATEVFPLNIGMVGAYALQEFGSQVEVRLFKYAPILEREINKNPPDVLAVSNYSWCHNLSMYMLEQLKRVKPEAIRVMGGPNFPHARTQQQEFLRDRNVIDAYCFLDGEWPFANLLAFLLKHESLHESRESLLEKSIAGCVQLDSKGEVMVGDSIPPKKNLDDIPSPYLMGIMDEFFDGRLNPMIQTNRGCPFSCTFCHDGSPLVSRVNQFSVDRVKEELTYVAQRVPETTKTLFVSDLNFGMFSRDSELCDHLADLQEEYDYPRFIDTTTGKNSKKRVINNVKRLAGTLGVTMSVQSMDQKVLRNIERQNMRLDEFFDIKPTIKKFNLDTNSEVILGLPGETVEQHFDAIDSLLQLDMDHILSYSLMMLNGTKLNTPEERERWGYQTKYRVIPRDFSVMSTGEKVVEVEEVAVASSTMSFDDYLAARVFVLMLQVVNTAPTKPILKYLMRRGLSGKSVIKDLIERLDWLEYQNSNLRSVFHEYRKKTKTELFDSEEELIKTFQDDLKFSGLVDGTYGSNLLQTYKAKILTESMEELVTLVITALESAELSNSAGLNDFSDAGTVSRDLKNFARAMSGDFLNEVQPNQSPEFLFKFNVPKWLEAEEDRPLSDFLQDRKLMLRFSRPDEYYSYLGDLYDQFGRDELGRGKVMIRLPIRQLWPTPIVVS